MPQLSQVVRFDFLKNAKSNGQRDRRFKNAKRNVCILKSGKIVPSKSFCCPVCQYFLELYTEESAIHTAPTAPEKNGKHEQFYNILKKDFNVQY